MIFQVEKLRDIQDELKPLLLDHYHEIAWRQDVIDLNPDYEKYYALEDAGILLIITVRDGCKMVGYTIYFIHGNPHYKDHVFGVNDIVFLKKEYRNAGTGAKLFSKAHEELKKRGCSVASIHMKIKQPFEELAQGLGYDKVEYNYAKYLGE